MGVELVLSTYLFSYIASYSNKWIFI